LAEHKFDTVRDLEKRNAKWFKTWGVVALAGIVFILIGLVSPAIMLLGLAALIVGAIMLFVGMLHVVNLSREPVRTIYCPYCASKNEVFVSKRELPCDICGRKIGITPHGEAVPLEPMDDDED
jgi:hypothetical protein